MKYVTFIFIIILCFAVISVMFGAHRTVTFDYVMQKVENAPHYNAMDLYRKWNNTIGRLEVNTGVDFIDNLINIFFNWWGDIVKLFGFLVSQVANIMVYFDYFVKILWAW